MSPLSILLIGFAMSTDAFAAAIGKGAAMRRPRLPDALRAGLIFGVIEAITPLLGWLLGRATSQYVEAFDHWIAFVLLGALGVHMIVAGLRPDAEEETQDAGDNRHHRFWTLAATGLATSIDAAAVGVSLAFLDVHIGVVALVIGLIISIFQAATQINEATLSFIPKLVGTLLVLLLAGPWMLQLFVDYIRQLFEKIPMLIG